MSARNVQGSATSASVVTARYLKRFSKIRWLCRPFMRRRMAARLTMRLAWRAANPGLAGHQVNALALHALGSGARGGCRVR